MSKRCLFLLISICLMLSAEGLAFADGKDDESGDGGKVTGSAEPDTFGDTARFLGFIGSGAVVLDPTCVFPPGQGLGPGDKCVILNPTARTDFDFKDLANISLPRGSARSLIFLLASQNYDYELLNSTSSTQPVGLFVSRPYITLESAALNDPRAVDPNTHMPLNGKLDLLIGTQRRVNKSMAAGERFEEGSNFSHASRISKDVLLSVGLPEDIVNRVFEGDITVRLNAKGSARLVDGASMFYTLRLMGN